MVAKLAECAGKGRGPDRLAMGSGRRRVEGLEVIAWALVGILIAGRSLPAQADSSSTAHDDRIGDVDPKDLTSGVPLGVASASYAGRVPEVATAGLSAGLVTKPIGHGNVYGGKLPDLFVVNSKESTHPGLYLYRYVSAEKSGAPRFRRGPQLTHPFRGLLPPAGHVVEHEGVIYGFWTVESNIVARTRYDAKAQGFVERREIHVMGLPRPPTSVLFLPDEGQSGDLVFEVPDRQFPGVAKSINEQNDRYRRPPYNPRDGLDDNVPRDASGMWRVKAVYSSLYSVRVNQFTSSRASHSARRITPTDHDAEYGYSGISALVTREKEGKRRSLVVGSVYGGLYVFHGHHGSSSFSVRPRQPLRSAVRSEVESRALRHPIPLPSPLAYPSKRGYTNLLVGGEGALQFYRFLGFSRETSMPLYSAARPVLESEALLYGGSHPVLTSADWDGDGRTDLVAGNAEGRVLFFKNVGTDQKPEFLAGIPVRACLTEVKAKGSKKGVHPSLLREVRAEAGYRAINGPAESSYGYAAPAVVDWNGDGIADLVMTDALGRHFVSLGAGAGGGGPPILQPATVLYCNDREVQGPWRVKPAVGVHLGRIMYVAVDQENHLHAYWKMDAQNLRDAGKLKMTDGKPIGTHYLLGSAVGRIDINLADFDADGTLDLVLAAPAHASVPREYGGLPQSLGLPGGAVLFLRGKKSGSRGPPAFHPPEIVHHNGNPLFIGREDGSVAVTTLGNSTGPHLLVGEEGGRIVFYDRMHLSCRTYNRFPVPGESEDGATAAAKVAMTARQIEAYLRPEFDFRTHRDLDISLVQELLVEGAGQGGGGSPADPYEALDLEGDTVGGGGGGGTLLDPLGFLVQRLAVLGVLALAGWGLRAALARFGRKDRDRKL